MNNKAPSAIGGGLDVPKRLRDGVITRKKIVSHLYRWRVPNLLTGGEHISPVSLKRQEEVLPAAKLEQRRYNKSLQTISWRYQYRDASNSES